MNKKLWAGRFDKAMAPEGERFTTSINLGMRLLCMVAVVVAMLP